MKKIDWKIVASGIVAYRRVKNGYLAPYPGVVATLLKMKQSGIKLAIVSDAPRLRAWTRLASMRLIDFFDVVVTYDDSKKLKPHPKPFRTALEKLKLRPENMLMVGDMPRKDIYGAKKLGIKTCFARYGAIKKVKNPNADFEINDFRELLKIVGYKSAKA